MSRTTDASIVLAISGILQEITSHFDAFTWSAFGQTSKHHHLLHIKYMDRFARYFRFKPQHQLTHDYIYYRFAKKTIRLHTGHRFRGITSQFTTAYNLFAVTDHSHGISMYVNILIDTREFMLTFTVPTQLAKEYLLTKLAVNRHPTKLPISCTLHQIADHVRFFDLDILKHATNFNLYEKTSNSNLIWQVNCSTAELNFAIPHLLYPLRDFLQPVELHRLLCFMLSHRIRKLPNFLAPTGIRTNI